MDFAVEIVMHVVGGCGRGYDALSGAEVYYDEEWVDADDNKND